MVHEKKGWWTAEWLARRSAWCFITPFMLRQSGQGSIGELDAGTWRMVTNLLIFDVTLETCDNWRLQGADNRTRRPAREESDAGRRREDGDILRFTILYYMSAGRYAMTDLPLGLRHALEGNNCVLFVGAGVGGHLHRPDGTCAPNGSELAKGMADHFGIDAEDIYDLAQISQAVELRKGRKELDTYVRTYAAQRARTG